MLRKIKNWVGVLVLVGIIAGITCSNLEAQEVKIGWNEFVGIDDFTILEIPYLDDDPHFDNEFNDYLKRLDKGLFYVKDLGVKWILALFIWDRLEPEQGKIAIKRLREIVNHYRKNGVNIVVVFVGSTPWNTIAPKGKDIDYILYPPKEIESYETTLKFLMKEFRDDIRYWMIWGEENDETSWKPRPDAGYYVKLLLSAKKVRDEVDGSCVSIQT